MQLTRHTDYAFRLLIYLGSHGAEPVRVKTISSSFGISFNHLAKVAQRLSQGGIVTTVRGRGGGVKLAVDPGAINLAEVVELMEPSLALVECFEVDGRCPIEPACALKGVIADAKGAFMGVLRKHTLADILDEPQALRALLALSTSS